MDDLDRRNFTLICVFWVFSATVSSIILESFGVNTDLFLPLLLGVLPSLEAFRSATVHSDFAGVMWAYMALSFPFVLFLVLRKVKGGGFYFMSLRAKVFMILVTMVWAIVIVNGIETSSDYSGRISQAYYESKIGVVMLISSLWTAFVALLISSIRMLGL